MYVKQNGKIKATKTNRILALAYYGYSSGDISTILGASSGHIYETLRKYPIDKRLTRPVPITMFQTKAEKDLLQDYTEQISAAYKKHQGTAKTGEHKSVEAPNQKVVVKETQSVKKATKKEMTESITMDTVTEDEEQPPSARVTKSQELVEEFHSDSFVRSKGYLHYLAEVDTELGEDGDCELCANKGWVMAPGPTGITKTTCPVCLGSSKIKKKKQLNEYDKRKQLNELIKNKTYLQGEFDFEKFLEGVLLPVELRGYSFNKYVEFMNDILNGLSNGILPTKSYYIVAPDGYGKKWFAYEVIKLLVEYNYKTTGLLNTVELSELLDSRSFAELNEKMDADIIMVSLTGLNKGYYSHVIKYLTEYADSQGKPLFVFSRVEAKSLVVHDGGMRGLIFNQTSPNEYGQLMQVGLQGQEFGKAYHMLVDASNESIGFKPSDDAKYAKNKKYKK